ncbi:MAG TPA: hypothetical protein VNI78_06515 [Vicinamibacterales bacterium]|nr:hypothetical protein [Vicinamibacterales bacterium]
MKPMADRRRGESRELKRDQQVRREVLSEIGREITQHRTPVQYRNPNRDQARGDWDRSGRHTDQESSRETGEGGDEGLRGRIPASGAEWSWGRLGKHR